MSCICLPYNTDQLVAAVKTGLDLVQVKLIDYIQINAPGLQVYLVWLPTALVVMTVMVAFAESLVRPSPSPPVYASVPWAVEADRRLDIWLRRRLGVTEPALWDDWESFIEFEYDTYEEEERVLGLEMQDQQIKANKYNKYIEAQRQSGSKAKTKEFQRHLAAINLMGQLSMTPLYTSIHPVNRDALRVVTRQPKKVGQMSIKAEVMPAKRITAKTSTHYHIKDWRRASEATVVEENEEDVVREDVRVETMGSAEIPNENIKQSDATQSQPQQPATFEQASPQVPTRPLRPSESQVLAAFDAVKAQGWAQGQISPVRPVRQSSTISEDRTLVNSTRSSSLMPSAVVSPGSFTLAMHRTDIEVEKVIAQAVHEVALLKNRNEVKPISWNELSKVNAGKTRTRSFFGFKREPKVEKLWEAKTIDVYRKQVHSLIKDTALEEQHRLVHLAAPKRDSGLTVVAKEPRSVIPRFTSNRPAPTPVQRPKLKIDTFPLQRVSARDGRASVQDLRSQSYQTNVSPVQTYKKLAIASPGRCNEERRMTIDRSFARTANERENLECKALFCGQSSVEQTEVEEGIQDVRTIGVQHRHSWTKAVSEKFERKLSVGSFKNWVSSVRSSKTGKGLLGCGFNDADQEYIPMLSPESISSPMPQARWTAMTSSGSATPGSIDLDGRIRSYMAIERVNNARRKAGDIKQQQRAERIKENAAVISQMMEDRRVEQERVRRFKEVTGVAFVGGLLVKG